MCDAAAQDRRDFRDEQSADDTLTTERANAALAALLLPRESVLKALQRLGRRWELLGGWKRRRSGSYV